MRVYVGNVFLAFSECIYTVQPVRLKLAVRFNYQSEDDKHNQNDTIP